MLNTAGRELPEWIEGYGAVVPFAGASASDLGERRPRTSARDDKRKPRPSLEQALRDVPVRDGMTLSFHHHLRDGDGVVNAVLATAAALGLRDLNIALSSVFAVHAPLVGHIESGVVGGLDTDYLAGPVADAVSRGALARPAILRTHGGRAAAIERGRLSIDVAFIAAPAADEHGNLNGTAGPSACGSLGYAHPDAAHADHVVAVTDGLVPYPLCPVSIAGTRVDQVVEVGSLGGQSGIASGTTRVTEDPARLEIARSAAIAIDAAGLLADGFSYQTGAGGTSLAVTQFVRRRMEERAVVGSFALGGITAALVEMLEAGLFESLLDVQDFDLAAVASLASNPRHAEIGADLYASPIEQRAAVGRLDCAILGATEVDTDFNVNVVTGSHGRVIGGSGGHSDAAAGARLAIVVVNPARAGRAVVVDRVLTATTPGETVDVVVAADGVAVNPRRGELAGSLSAAGLEVREIAQLRSSPIAAQAPEPGARVVAVVEYRDGTVIDLVRQVR